ncbi:hypothetical protein DTO271G3_3936 [Paecilomyces variotii]|nr:hypothetical protein DTO271G3_3936 [Paecilomyces variotii]
MSRGSGPPMSKCGPGKRAVELSQISASSNLTWRDLHGQVLFSGPVPNLETGDTARSSSATARPTNTEATRTCANVVGDNTLWSTADKRAWSQWFAAMRIESRFMLIAIARSLEGRMFRDLPGCSLGHLFPRSLARLAVSPLSRQLRGNERSNIG